MVKPSLAMNASVMNALEEAVGSIHRVPDCSMKELGSITMGSSK